MTQNKNLEIASGLGLGLLVGIIIGLSVTHVVGIILGALTSLLATFFGLTASKDGDQSKQSKFNTKPLTIFCFGLSTACFILIGIYLRTHNSLGPSLKQQKEELVMMGLKPEEISKVLLKLRFDMTLDAKTNIPTMSEIPNGSHGSLFSAEADSIINERNHTLKELVKIYTAEQGSALDQYYNVVKLYVPDTTKQKDILDAAYKLLKGKTK
jgi:hypothetical protein